MHGTSCRFSAHHSQARDRCVAKKWAERESKARKRMRKLDENIRRTRVCSTCFKFHCCATPSLIKPNFAELWRRNLSFPDGKNFRIFLAATIAQYIIKESVDSSTGIF